MLVLFSSQVPVESATLDEKYSPFRSFIIETSPKVQASKFLSRSKRKPEFLLPSCVICNMHFTPLSTKKKGESLWICSFCDKENKIDAETFKRLEAPSKYCIKEPNDFSMISTSDFFKPRNLVILVLDFSILMENLSIKFKNKDLTYTQWISSIMKRDLAKYTESTKFCLIVCSTEVKILASPPFENSCILPFLMIENMSHCYEFGKDSSKKIFSSEPNYSKLTKNLEEIKPRSLSSIGSGLAVAFGILNEMKPVNHKILVIGEGTVGVGVCRNYELGELRECAEEIEDLSRLVKKTGDLNLYLYNVSGEDTKENFLYCVKKKMKIAKYAIIKENDENGEALAINLAPEETKEKNEYILRVAASPNIILIPCENSQKSQGKFEEKRRTLVMRNMNPEKNLYPFSFVFSTNGCNNETILIQSEYIVKREEESEIFVTTKKLKIVKFKEIEFSFLNFTVPNLWFFMNDLLKNKEKMKAYKELINFYLLKSNSQVDILKFLKNYIENNYKFEFEIKIPIGQKDNSLAGYVQKRKEIVEKKDFKIYGKTDDDFEKLVRVSKKKVLQRKF